MKLLAKMLIQGTSVMTDELRSRKFRKKPVVIEAMQYDGSLDSAHSICQWAHKGLPPEANTIIRLCGSGFFVRTLEGSMRASPTDWIIRGVKGEFYPCKKDIFEATYEEVL